MLLLTSVRLLWSESVCVGITGERFVSPTIQRYDDVVETFRHAAMLKKWEKSLAPYTEIVPRFYPKTVLPTDDSLDQTHS